MARILCVAEKPSIAKAVANHLNSQARAVSNYLQNALGSGSKLTIAQEDVRGIRWVKNYKFDYDFQRWGRSSVTFTCVAGHILQQDFPDRFRQWTSCPPAALFEAPIRTSVAEVRFPY
jgi:DNA topoisomerase-3